MIPTCPTHNKPMRPGKGGAYYCPTKMPDGSWCPFKAEGPATTSQSAQTSTTASASDARWAAALGAASQVFRGSGAEMADELLALALRFYKSFP